MRITRLSKLLGSFMVCSMLLLACQTTPPSSAPSAPAATADIPSVKPAAIMAKELGATPVPAAKPAGQSVAAPTRGGTFVFALTADPPALNPAISTGLVEQTTGCVMYQGLVFVDREYNIKPFLAESWEVSPDNLVFTFNLRKDVKWHDGHPFTAEDVKFTYEEVIAKYHPRSKELFANVVSSVDVLDPYKVRITLNEVYGPFLGQLNCWNAAILPKHIFEGTDILSNPHNTRDVIGTGAFKFESWIPGDRITFVRNDDYWVPGEPYLDRMVFKIIPDAAARTAALEAGEIDYIVSQSLQPQDFLRLKDDPRFQVGYGLGLPTDQMLTLNTQNAPLNDKRVRQALMMAIDRDLIDEQVFFRIGNVAKSFVSTDLTWAYDPSVDLTKMYPYDPQKANEMLDAAGFPRGADGNRVRPLKFVYETGRTGFQEIAQIVARNWAAVGVPVQLVPLERNVMIDTVYVKRDFDVNVNQLGTTGDPELGYRRQYACDSILPVQFTNGSGYCNPEVDRLFDLGTAQVENEKRAPYYYQLQHILAEDLPVLPLRNIGWTDLASAKFEFSTSLWTSAQITDMWGGIYLREG